MEDIKGFLGYKIDVLGRVYSYKNNRWGFGCEMKEINTSFKTKKGYRYVRFYYNNKKYVKFIHRLVAQAFIPNPLNKPQVNHINGIKTDNRADNLEWVTNIENMTHARELGLFNNAIEKMKVKVNKLSLDGVFLKTYNSVREASIDVGLRDNTPISKCLKGVSKTSKGYKWEYYEKN